MRTGCLLLIMITAISSTSFAESMTGYSAEWLSHQSSLIAVATPLSVEEIKGEGDIRFIKTRFKVIDIYKGPLSNRDTVTVFNLTYSSTKQLMLKKAAEEKKKLLIFCNVAKNVAKEVNGKYIFTVYHEFSSAYYTDQPVEKLYTPDFQLLTEYSELLERTKKQIEEERDFALLHREMRVVRKRIEAPYDSPAGQDLYAGSDCGIWIPEYQKLNNVKKP